MEQHLFGSKLFAHKEELQQLTQMARRQAMAGIFAVRPDVLNFPRSDILAAEARTYESPMEGWRNSLMMFVDKHCNFNRL